jgi:hypothetical protein
VVAICDNLFYPYQALGIHDPETNIKIPLQVQRSFTFLKARSSTLKEIHDCKTIVVTSKTEWRRGSGMLMCLEAGSEIEAIRTELRVERVRADSQPLEPQVLIGSSESNLAAVPKCIVLCNLLTKNGFGYPSELKP